MWTIDEIEQLIDESDKLAEELGKCERSLEAAEKVMAEARMTVHTGALYPLKCKIADYDEITKESGDA